MNTLKTFLIIAKKILLKKNCSRVKTPQKLFFLVSNENKKSFHFYSLINAFGLLFEMKIGIKKTMVIEFSSHSCQASYS